MSRAVLRLSDGKAFTIVADGLSDANRYVDAVALNGRPLARSYLRDAEIRAGGELRFTMAAAPNTAWGRAKVARPFALSPYSG